MMRAAAVLAWFAGLGFGLPCGYAIWYFADRGQVWTFLGFPTYGGGSFEDIGIQTTVPLLVLFLLVCAAELTAGWLLWQRRRAGAVLALALLPAEAAFWIGFDLPAGPVLGLARTALVLLGWPSLNRCKNACARMPSSEDNPGQANDCEGRRVPVDEFRRRVAVAASQRAHACHGIGSDGCHRLTGADQP